MCLLDTVDGALMSALYTTSSFAHDDIAIIYYSIVLTVITVLVAVMIGVIQVLSLLVNVLSPTGRFWDGVEKVGERYDIVGGCIAATFALAAAVSVAAYGPWRRRLNERMATTTRGVVEDTGSTGTKDGENNEVARGGDHKVVKQDDLVDIERVGESSRGS